MSTKENNVRLIDVDVYDDKLHELMMKYDGYDSCQNKIIQGLMEAQDLLYSVPTVDAVPVVHGRWEWRRVDEITEVLTCSACSGMAWADEHNKYCPNCGAKMELEDRRFLLGMREHVGCRGEEKLSLPECGAWVKLEC